MPSTAEESNDMLSDTNTTWFSNKIAERIFLKVSGVSAERNMGASHSKSEICFSSRL